ncbi:MAG: hypothetical protein ACD_75C01657G0002 [uncultured bacterium]|nr:MAG: hypothetical protein ACD_75C01657G0002 [uncultured bacterium]
MGFQLGGEGYFRHQDQHIPALCKGFFRRPEIHLRFAAAGNAMEKKRREASCPDGRLYYAECAGLLVGKFFGAGMKLQLFAKRIAKNTSPAAADNSFGFQLGQRFSGPGILGSQIL